VSLRKWSCMCLYVHKWSCIQCYVTVTYTTWFGTGFLKSDIHYTRASQMKTLNILYPLIYRTQKVHNDLIFLCSLHCTAISFTVTRRFSFTMSSTVAMPSGVTTGCAWSGRGEFCYRTNAVHELPSPLVHLLQWQTCINILNFHSSMNFDGVHP